MYGRCHHMMYKQNVVVCTKSKYTNTKASNEPAHSPFGRCSRNDCQMYQRYEICKMQLSVKLLFIVNAEQLSLNALGQTVLDITNAKDMDELTEKLIPPIATFCIH